MAEGDPRVHFLMNLVLSFAFSWVVLTALAFVDVAAFSWTKVAAGTLVLMLLTQFVTR